MGMELPDPGAGMRFPESNPGFSRRKTHKAQRTLDAWRKLENAAFEERQGPESLELLSEFFSKGLQIHRVLAFYNRRSSATVLG